MNIPNCCIDKQPSNRASALALVLVFTLIAGIATSAILKITMFNTRQVHKTRVFHNSLSGARSVLDTMENDLRFIVQTIPPQLEGDLGEIPGHVSKLTASAPLGYKIVSYPGFDGAHKKPLAFTLSNNDAFSFSQISKLQDPWYGYSTGRLEFELVAAVIEESNRAENLNFPGMALSRRVVADYIPLYQFALFYDPPLEIFPLRRTKFDGRVHTNGRLSVASTFGLEFHEKVSSVGPMERYLSLLDHLSNSWVSLRPGPVRIADSDGALTDYRSGDETNGDGYLTSADDNWLAESQNRWHGQLQDKAYGVQPIRPPLPPGIEPRAMMERAQHGDSAAISELRFENKACLVVEGDPANIDSIRAYHQIVDDFGNRTITDLPTTFTNADGETESWVDVGIFFDGRETTVVRTIDVDLGLLAESNVVNFASESAIVYVSTTPVNSDDAWTVPQDPTEDNGIALLPGWSAPGVDNYMPAVRVLNAAEVPKNLHQGFGFYTDRPLYVTGDVNTVNKGTVIFGADAVTLTSQKLSLSYVEVSPENPLDITLHTGNTVEPVVAPVLPFLSSLLSGGRDTLNTNAIFLTGVTAPTTELLAGQLQSGGGGHNALRYLESLGRVRHNFNGSIVVLFESTAAVAPMLEVPLHFVPPRKNFRWDSSLKTAVPPPGTPLLLSVQSDAMRRIPIAQAIKLYDRYEMQ